jgi:hypothetical protein
MATSGGKRHYKLPHCEKCGNDHYNFQACPPRQDVKPQIVWRSDTDRMWGDRMIDLKHLGGNTFVQRREHDR